MSAHILARLPGQSSPSRSPRGAMPAARRMAVMSALHLPGSPLCTLTCAPTHAPAPTSAGKILHAFRLMHTRSACLGAQGFTAMAYLNLLNNDFKLDEVVNRD